MQETGRTYSRFWRLVSVIVLCPLISALIRNRYQGAEHIPRSGPVIFAPNHLSYADWATDMLFFYRNGRYPTALVKSGAFTVPVLGWLLRRLGQLPVHRGEADAARVLEEARKRLARGAAVVIYPEGTATRDPDLWPMTARSGVARLALDSGAPVIPVAHWGTDDILHYGDTKPSFFPRKTVRTVAGPPVDLSRWTGPRSAGQGRSAPLSAEALSEATGQIMDDITGLLAGLRGEPAPAVRYDRRTGR